MKRREPLLVALILTAGLLVAGGVRPAGRAGAAPSNTVPFTVVETGTTSGVRAPTQVVVRDAGTWAALWRSHAGPGAPVPAVDFSRDMIIAVFAGESPARTVAISRIAREQGGLVVWYVLRETGPQSDGQVTERRSAFQIVRLARLAGSVRFLRVKTPPVVPQP